MWIRSQDKITLAYCTRLAVVGKTIQNLPPTMFEDDYDILGEYENKERALEVLDEIEKQLGSITEIIETAGETKCKSHWVYEMPEK